MPLYVADYLADTAHLNAAQSGAYLHLIMHYWQKGSLPPDDAQLAAIARMSLSEWKRARSIVAAFFQDGWTHRRIDRELTEANDKYRRRSAAGKKGADAFVANLRREGNALTDARPLPDQPQPQSQTRDRIGEAHARGASMLTEGSKARAVAFWTALGFADPQLVPPEFAGVDVRAVEWETAGWSLEMIAVEARRIGPAKPLSYHEKVFATAHARLHAPLPKVEIREAETVQVTHANPQHGSGVVAAARRLAERFEGESGGRLATDPAPVLRLSQG
jgi:uncharacterized protein YdaU (DUF1376 family)